MESMHDIRQRWRYLRQLLLDQLDRFESGAMSLHVAGQDTSPHAIDIIKKNILEFDRLISDSKHRGARIDALDDDPDSRGP